MRVAYLGLLEPIFNFNTAGRNLIGETELTDSNVLISHNNTHTGKMVGKSRFGVHGG